MRRGYVLALGATLCILGCGQPALPAATPSFTPARPPTAVPTPDVAPTPSSAPTPSPAATARPSTTPTVTPSPLAFPTESEVELEIARYSSSPPFDIPFTFEVTGPGWYSAHLHGEFFDVMRFDGREPHVPTRWLAWAHPAVVYGDGGGGGEGADGVPAAGLSPAQAAATVADNADLDAGAPSSFTFAGLEGVQLDVHTDSANVPVFGGPAGNFGLQPSHDARLGFVALGEELLVVMCLGETAELDAACADVQPIVDSVRL